jgi:ribosomal protein S15P/S13E
MNIQDALQEIYSQYPNNLKPVIDLTLRIRKLSNHIVESRQKDKYAKRSLSILVARRRKISRHFLGKEHFVATIKKIDSLLESHIY